MNFKYPFYHKTADPQGVAEAYIFLQEFYTRYPTGLEVGEALHQVRRELDLIPREKTNDRVNAKSRSVSTPDTDTEGHTPPKRRRRPVADAGTGSSGTD